MPSFVGAIDQGTTKSRFIIFDDCGQVMASHMLELKQLYPQAGWVEHDPMDILESVRQVIRVSVDTFVNKGHQASDIKAIGITNQRETAVAWDKRTGKPICNAIVWSDTRTKPLVHDLANSHPEKSVHCLKVSVLYL
ncbi:Glycerol kinase [Dispira simplex]|nr:Glycerol kinase [Dispira simplex]